jgi:hypothetical protein
MNYEKWSKKEKSIARAAFDKAYDKECNQIIGKLKEKSLKLSDPEDIWELHDYLSEIRKEIDEKYDYRYSVLIMVFAHLLKQQWLKIDDLEGLSVDKIDRIKSLANI